MNKEKVTVRKGGSKTVHPKEDKKDKSEKKGGDK